MGPYLGDFKAGSILYFTWDTNDGNGASINPTVPGTISVYKDANVVQSVAGVTDVRAFDGLVGVHNCTIDTTNAFYATGHDYSVVLSAATIDTQVVNATLATFSIENRNMDISALAVDNIWDELSAGHKVIDSFGQIMGNARANTATGGGLTSITLDAGASAINDFYNGNLIFITSGAGVGQTRIITDYDGGSKIATIQPDFLVATGAGSQFVIIPTSSISLVAIAGAILDADLQAHLGVPVGGRNIGNILGQLAQSEFEQRTNVFATIPVPAQGITLNMVARGCIQYQQVIMSYTKNWAAPDKTYYLLYHYNAQHRQDIVKASLGIVW